MSAQPLLIDVQIGARIRDRRRALRLSQTALANAVSLTFQQIQKYERGANRVSASTLVRIADFLETSVSDLIGEIDPGRDDRPQRVQSLDVAGTAELIALYRKIPAPQFRKALIQLARTMSASTTSP